LDVQVQENEIIFSPIHNENILSDVNPNVENIINDIQHNHHETFEDINDDTFKNNDIPIVQATRKIGKKSHKRSNSSVTTSKDDKNNITKGQENNTGVLAFNSGANAFFQSKRVRLNTNTKELNIQVHPTRQELIFFNKINKLKNPSISFLKNIEKINKQNFNDWSWKLQSGNNLLLFGTGCHKKLIKDFSESYLNKEVSIFNYILYYTIYIIYTIIYYTTYIIY
jgi:hypothetical protein